MLQSFNDRLKGPFTWIIVISVSTVFVLTGSSFLFSGGSSKAATVAKVGSYDISTQQYQGYVEQTKSTTAEQKKELLDMLIEQRLMMSAAQEENIMVSKLAMQSAIFNNPAFQDDKGQFSQEKLQMAAKYYGGVSNIENMLGQNILLSTIPNSMSNTGFKTDDEKDQLAKIYSQEKSISYLKFDPKVLEATEKVSDADLQKYFAEHKQEYIKPETQQLEYYVVSKDDFISEDAVSDADVKAYYDNNTGLFTTFDDKAKDSIQKILKNRAALIKYNATIQNIDAQKFAVLSKELGKAKDAAVENNNASDIKGIANASFFSGDKYGVLQVSDDSAVIYYVESSEKQKQQTLAEVKTDVTKAYKVEEAQAMADDKATTAIANIQKGAKIAYPFEKTVVSNDTKDIDDGFKQAVLESSDKVASYKADDGVVYVYQIDKIDTTKANVKNVPLTVMNAYDKAEQDYYTEVLRNEIPVKINQKNI